MPNRKLTSIYLANASAEPSRRKDVQGLKQQQQNLQSIFSSEEFEILIEGKNGQAFGYEIFSGQDSSGHLSIIHLMAMGQWMDKFYLNTASGKRQPLEGHQFLFDHQKNIQLVILDGAGTIDWIEHLLFAGVPQVMALPDASDRSIAFRQDFYDGLANGLSFRKAFEAANALQADAFKLQEIPNDPYQYWSIKEALMQEETLPGGLYFISAEKEILTQRLGIELETATQKVVQAATQNQHYFCTQELKGEELNRNHDMVRKLESLGIEQRLQLWRQFLQEDDLSESVLETPVKAPENKVSEVSEEAIALNGSVEAHKELESAPVSKEVNSVQEQKAEIEETFEKNGIPHENQLVNHLVGNYTRSFKLAAPNRKRQRMVAGISLLIMLLILSLVITWRNNWETSADQGNWESPLYQSQVFETSRTFNVLLMPFHDYLNCNPRDVSMEKEVRDHLNVLRESQEVGLKVSFLNFGQCPKNSAQALQLGKEYKADLVVWGNYDQFTSHSNFIHVQYVSLQESSDVISSWLGGNIGREALGGELKEGVFSGETQDLVYWILGLAHLYNESYAETVSYLKQVSLDNRKEHAVIHHLLAKCYQAMHLNELALSAYNESICLDPTNEYTIHGRGRFYQHQRQIGLALQDFEQVLALNPKNTRAARLKEMLIGNQDQDYEEEIPDQMYAYNQIQPLPGNVSIIREESGATANKEDKPLTEEQRLAQLEEERRRKIWLRRQQLLRQVEEYTEMIRENPGKASLYYQRGSTYEKLRDDNRAVADYSLAIRLNPGYWQAYVDRGSLFKGQQSYQKALSDYNEALRLSQDDANIYAVRAELLRVLGRYVSAEADAKKAVHLEPGNRTYQRLLGKISAEITSY